LDQTTAVRIVRIEKHLYRSGFPNDFHRVTFELKGACADSSVMGVWVDAACPDMHLHRVAHSILRRHLLDLARTAKGNALPPQEVDALFKRAIKGKESSTLERRKKARRPQPGNSECEVIGEPRIVRYILEGNEPVPCENLATWKQHMIGSSRRVKDTTVVDASQQDVRVCTAFMGLDLSFGLGPPTLFETTVLGGVFDREVYRYCTWQQAMSGHAAVVDRVVGQTDGDSTHAINARDLAQLTMNLAAQAAINALLEQAASDGAIDDTEVRESAQT